MICVCDVGRCVALVWNQTRTTIEASVKIGHWKNMSSRMKETV